MTLTVTGYTGWTGNSFGDLSGWATLNDLYFSGLYVDVTGLHERLFNVELDLLGKVDLRTTYTDFADIQATFRNQLNTRLKNVENSINDIKTALIAVRRTLQDFNTRITALE